MKNILAILFLLAACTVALADGGSIPLCPPGTQSLTAPVLHDQNTNWPPTCSHKGGA